MLTTANIHLTALQRVLDYLEDRDEPVLMGEVGPALNLSPHPCEQLLVKLWEDGVIDSNESESDQQRTYWINIEGKLRQQRSGGIYDPSRGVEYVDPGGGFGFRRHTPDVPGRRMTRKKVDPPKQQPELAKPAVDTYAEDVESLKVLMTGAATDVTIDAQGEADYKRLRSSLIPQGRFKKVAPQFIFSCGSLKEFRTEMQSRAPDYKTRRLLIKTDFMNLIESLHGGTAEFDPVADMVKSAAQINADQLPQDLHDKGKEMAEVYAYLYYIENFFRMFIDRVREAHPISIPTGVQQTIDILKRDEQNRKYLPVRGGNDLFYCDFDQLRQIMIRNWAVFGSYFPNKNEHWLTVTMEEVVKIRHFVAHNSYVGPDERAALQVNYKKIVAQLHFK